jgi:sarcosine oxidase subunit beta
VTAHATETLVVGGGVIGSSIAYHLARQGRRVLVVERAGVAVEPAASWASAGGVRRQGRDPAEAALAREAVARWPSLAGELGADLQYRQGGNLLVAETDDQAERLARFVPKQHAMGFTDVRLIDGHETRELAPHVGAQVVAASYSPGDGQANAPRTTRAFAAAAERSGAVYWTGIAVEALLARGDRVLGARTGRGDVAAETVVLAAGAWSDELVSGIGLRLPVRAAAYQMLRSTPAAPGLLRQVLSAVKRSLSIKQLPDGSFLVGGGWPGDIGRDRRSYRLREPSISGNWETACAILPVLAAQRVDRAWCGLEAESIDALPLIGPAPRFAGLVLAVGFSGHGFAIAPAVGRAVADQIAGRPVPELDGLSPARIARLDPEEVKAFAG